MTRLSLRGLLLIALGSTLMFGPRDNVYALALLAAAGLVLLVPRPGASLGRAWRYACDHHPVVVSLIGIVLALACAAGAWVGLAGPFVLLAGVFA